MPGPASDLHNLAADIGEAAADVRARVAVAVTKTAFDIEATAKQLVPVDTAATKNSIGIDLKAGGLVAEIGPTTEYAPYLEYGTSVMAPHAFMGPALDRHTPDFVHAVMEAGATIL